jgi:small GTP-binding protein
MLTQTRKICMVGDFGVGKTSLIRRFVEGKFSDQYLSTVGVKISRKTVSVTELKDHSSFDVKLLIWDIEGQTKFKGITTSYLQGSGGFLIVGDVQRDETLQHLSDHIDLCLSVNPQGIIAVALNKTDLITVTEREQLLSKIQEKLEARPVIKLYSTSAKTGDHVEEIFQNIAAKIFQNS